MTTHVQARQIGTGNGFLTAPTPGNLVVIFANHRDGTPNISTGGITDFGVTGGGPGAQGCRGGYRIWQPGDSNSFSFDGIATILELPGSWAFVTAIARDEPGADTTAFFGGNPNGITGHSGETGLLIGDDMGGSDGQTYTYASSGGSVIVDQKSNGTAPSWAVAYRDVVGAGANEYLLATKTASSNTGGITAFFIPLAVPRSQSPGFIG